jgi:2-polyprenyl-3-methyl-5-hydroxy-6-metoxy-1,4-benzoquinol methylase
MEIAIVAGGMPFGPRTLETRSLGGSEQAALLVSLELGKIAGNQVTVFHNQPEKGSPDFVEPGAMFGNVRWAPIEQYSDFIQNTEVDLLVVQRDPRLLNLPHQARRAVLWAHDLATYTFTADAVSQLGTNWHEVWVVSEFHRKQFHEVTGYPLENIKATRNGCLPISTVDVPRTRTLLYAARPERGLEHLIKPGGVMDQLKGQGFVLKVSMYENFPPQLHDYYSSLYAMCRDRPDVQHMGCLTQAQLRQEMAQAFAYVYCTDFEETSCIIVRECSEQGLPMVYSKAGALPESVAGCGVEIKGEAKLFQDNEATYKKFAAAIKDLSDNPDKWLRLSKKGKKRKDLYWDGVAKQWMRWCKKPVMDSTIFSRAWSLLQDSDVIPAIAWLWHSKDQWTWADNLLYEDMKRAYPFVDFPDRRRLYGLKEHYDKYYKELERPKTDLAFHDVRNQGRWQGLNAEIKALPPGAKILDYACGEGSQLICLAAENPDKEFYGIDISEDEVECCIRNAQQAGLPIGESNIKAIFHGTNEDWPLALLEKGPFDAAMMNEVLEHVYEPWAISGNVEGLVRHGGRIILTVPNGPWEMYGCNQHYTQYPWRAHIWHLDKGALRHMFQDKRMQRMSRIPNQHMRDTRTIGNTVFSYEADHEPIPALNPLQKAKDAWVRQTCAAAIICHEDEDTILRTLNSIEPDVQIMQFAQGPSNDHTRQVVTRWLSEHPWIKARWVDVPKIHAPTEDSDGFGFEDARNASVEGLDHITDWTLWIDTDEYLSGNLSRYCRPHAFDALAIHQHHFTCDPRGTPAQLDRPARLFRNRKGFVCYGKVHEHFEKGKNGGPGYCHLAQDIDIGHPGYVNETVRRSRFSRNFPLLEWDRKANPSRKLGIFLWFRDIVHRMRYYEENGRRDLAGMLAKEGVEFYAKHSDDMDAFGNGTAQAFAYYGECVRYLGGGLEFEIGIKMKETGENQPTQAMTFNGVANDPKALSRVLEKIVTPEIEKRNSKYWR